MFKMRLLIFCGILVIVSAQTDVPGETQYGPVVGVEETFSGKTVRRFLGIPFAKPPTDDLRFKDPQPPTAWTDPLDTKAYTPYCMQAPLLTNDTSEDCLYLNVFSPPNATDLPVMVWIYGGSLLVGSAEQYDPETLATVGELVVVTINYRVSIFGFLSTGDGEAEGNAGLKDQVMALKWVKENIANFGGDPDQITIFGESAGSWSVNAHMVSPMSRGLFHRAISQSGSLYTINLQTGAERWDAATAVVTKAPFNCPKTNDTKKVLKCLQDKPAELLLSIESSVIATASALVTGDSFLPKAPETYWNSGDVVDADYIMGVNSEEGTTALIFIEPAELLADALQNGAGYNSAAFNTLAMITLGMLGKPPGSMPQAEDPLWNLLSNQYINGDINDNITVLRAGLDMAADALFVGPTLANLKVLKKKTNNKAYLYYFDQVITPAQTPSQIPAAHIATSMLFPSNPALKMGASHFAEVAYAFGQLSEDLPEMRGNIYNFVSEDDRKVGKSMMNAWVSFAKTGVPKFVSSTNNDEIEWPEYDMEEQKYLEIKFPMSEDSVKERLLPQRQSIYTDILPVFLKSLEPPRPGPPPAEPCDDTPSTIDRDKAETALFILCAVVIVLLLLTFIVLNNYCQMKKQVKELEEANDKKYQME